jgi:hypothetical protein
MIILDTNAKTANRHTTKSSHDPQDVVAIYQMFWKAQFDRLKSDVTYPRQVEEPAPRMHPAHRFDDRPRCATSFMEQFKLLGCMSREAS